jgi:hypothetical protein
MITNGVLIWKLHAFSNLSEMMLVCYAGQTSTQEEFEDK